MRRVSGARRSDSALYDEARHDPVKSRVIIPARFDQLQKVAYVLRREVRLHLNSYIAEARPDQNIFSHLIYRRIFEWLDLLWLNLDARDFDRSYSRLLFVCGYERNLINDLNAFCHLSECRILAVELRLRRCADEELSAAAVRTARYSDC